LRLKTHILIRHTCNFAPRSREDCFHIRSWLDHDRDFCPDAAQGTGDIRLSDVPVPNGAYVDPKGGYLSGTAVLRDLHRHMERWGSVTGPHGLLSIELHAVDPAAVARVAPPPNSMSIEATHFVTAQYPVQFAAWTGAAEAAGWEVQREGRVAAAPSAEVAFSIVHFVPAGREDAEEEATEN
jgi:hypothetical protein